MARKLKVWVDHQSCVGNAMCESIAAKTFRLNDDRQSEIDQQQQAEAADAERRAGQQAEGQHVAHARRWQVARQTRLSPHGSSCKVEPFRRDAALKSQVSLRERSFHFCKYAEE